MAIEGAGHWMQENTSFIIAINFLYFGPTRI